jgi:ribonuclease Z
MRMHILGSGTPTPAATRHGSSYVLEVAGKHVMFDCGPSTTTKLARAGMDAGMIDELFFTHHHFDHNADYPCFLLSRWDQSIDDSNPLKVFGPDYTQEFTRRLMDEDVGAFAPDWIARINHPLSLNAHKKRGGSLPRKPPKIDVSDMVAGDEIRAKDWKISTAAAHHVQPWLESLAYRLDSDEGSIVVTGDTGPCESVVELASGADAMVSICTYVQSDIEGTPEASYQCGSVDVAKMAQAAGVGMLVLVHQVHMLDEPGQMERALRDISRHFDGEVVWGQELMAFDIN